MGAEHLAQRPVQHVRRGVVSPDAVAPYSVDRRFDFIRLGDRALPDNALVHDERAGEAVLRVAHVDGRARGRGERSGVADLTTGLRVERRAVEHDVDRTPGINLADALAVDDQREYLCA